MIWLMDWRIRERCLTYVTTNQLSTERYLGRITFHSHIHEAVIASAAKRSSNERTADAKR
jgi:hypothetical protein